MQRLAFTFACLLFVQLGVRAFPQEDDPIPGAHRQRVNIKSSADGTSQPCYVILPPGLERDSTPVPILVGLHSWSGDVEQRNQTLEKATLGRGWIYLFPHFRGRNDHPEACGSLKAQQDILDAVAWAKKEYPIDEERIYLSGVSGGGHMTMLMASRYPEVWTAASAWAGISDLAAWYRLHSRSGYGEMMRQTFGGAPGESAEIAAQYRSRSPLTHIQRAVNLPLDIATGVHDGHRGSVPVRHSLEAFNLLARKQGATEISDREIADLSRRNGRLRAPLPSDRVQDPTYGRHIHLRRTAGNVRVTIFEGGHEMIAEAAVEWLGQHRKKK